MRTTVLVKWKDFQSDILPAIPVKQPPLATLPNKVVSDAKGTLSKLFYGDQSNPKKLLNVKEDDIADTVVDVINAAMSALELPKEHLRYKAALSRYKANPSDEMRSKVDAAIYEEDDAPTNDNQWPDWTNCRFYIELKRGDVKYDLWDDCSLKVAENESHTRANVRAQLIAYTKNVFLYQHRTALFSLLIIGNSFRAARWDRSGAIVSKKVNYVDEPQSLLDFICHLVQLEPTLQGLDPTADLIELGMKAFRVMNELAEPNSELDMEYMEPGTENYIPPPAHPPPTESAPDGVSEPSGSVAAGTAPQQGVTPPAGAPKTRTRGKQPASAKPHVTQDLPTGIQDAKEDPDDDLPTGKFESVDGEDPHVFRYVREKFRESLVPGWPRYKLRIKVRVGNKDKVRVFLVAKPLFEAPSMFGRATRGYVAIDVRTGRFVFLKDSW
ncbi:hypothetical protein TRAPUB_6591 [Trametes pubescens]|uniref:Fungal-type protein kinase domain-containing protein n=1 Tax=Trametes pubescens TaxID=154538 RepID=A0A1M2V5U7_TRAPU|nr:hypothetical protein TRAPUB_6591 [Trametes pubescens]